MTEGPPPKGDDSSPEQPPEIQSKGQHPQRQESDPGSPGKGFQEMFAGLMQFGPARNPLAEKVTSAHLTEILSIQREGLQRTQTDREGQRRHHTTLCIIACVFVFALVALLVFTGNSALTEKLIIALTGVVAGAFGGYGYGTRKRD